MAKFAALQKKEMTRNPSLKPLQYGSVAQSTDRSPTDINPSCSADKDLFKHNLMIRQSVQVQGPPLQNQFLLSRPSEPGNAPKSTKNANLMATRRKVGSMNLESGNLIAKSQYMRSQKNSQQNR